MSACPTCGSIRSKVLETRYTATGWIKRRRRCLNEDDGAHCTHRWNTFEIPELHVMVQHDTTAEDGTDGAEEEA
jgi:transcriptional regulator NrdR family protein